MSSGACYETRHRGGDALATHRHHAAYAALVVDGAHEELSVDGSLRCTPGTLLLHPCFHAHGNRFSGGGARVLNRTLHDDASTCARVLRVPGLREARRVFEHGDARALAALIEACEPVRDAPVDDGWRGAMLRALDEGDAPVACIARELGVSPAYASRALLRSHGMGPLALRRELRWRRALALLHGPASLAEIALQAGFADQSHLSKVALAHSGLTPARLRVQVKSVQDDRMRSVAQSA
jgi:AraC family transcriptional regulator